MGAENSILSNVEWGEKYTDTGQDWTIENGELENGIEISMFTVSKKERKHKELLRKLAKQLKSIRHPAILHYIDFQEGSDGPFLISEQVVPLQSILGSLSSVEICSGLHAILEALSFLHEKAGVCHNNVCQKSIYVCHDGSWRLGGLEHACKFNEATPAFLQSSRAFRTEEALAPEEKQEKVEVKPELGHARDVYGLAVLADELLEKLSDLGDMTKTFELRIQDECLNPDPWRRPKIESLLNDRLFTTEFLQIATFLKNVTLKSEDERKSFFMNLLPKLLSLPEELVGRRLVPLILSRFVILDQTACHFVLPHLLTPCSDENLPTEEQEGVTPLLTVECYKQYIIPMLVKIFRVHDHHIRMVLLQYFSCYANLIDPEILEFEIFPQILLGLRDTSDELAASSLRALADVVPILGRDVVIGGRAKNYFRKGMPKIVDGDSIRSNNDDSISSNNGDSINSNNGDSINSNNVDSISSNNRAHNVNSVMGKTLLKDLAKFSTHHSPKHITEEEKEHKWKEREKRREEARLRREQRKLERETKQKEIKNSVSKDDPDGISSPRSISDTNGFLNSQEDKLHSDNLDPHINTDNKTDEQSEDSFNKTTESDWSKEKSHSISSGIEKDDWSDWENDEIESQISEEIEKELENMHITDVSTDETKKSDYNFKQKRTLVKEPQRHPVHSKSGAMKLEKKVKPVKSEIEVEIDKIDTTNVTSTTKVAKFSSAKKHQSRKSSKDKPTSSNPNTELGAEFDIKSINIKVDPVKKADPLDFFADMAPTISYSKPLNDENSTENEGPKTAISEEKEDGAKTVSFDVIQPTQDEADVSGWGDEWGNEDF